jgi:integrase
MAVNAALDARSSVVLGDLRREDAKKVRDYMLARRKSDGSSISPASVKRDLNILKAVINHAVRELDLERAGVSNPFNSLVVEDVTQASAIETREPLPTTVLEAMRRRSMNIDLMLIWRLLEGTGCRLAEVVGLRREDVVDVEGDLPHLRIVSHETRRLKTASSRRLVPLVGDALTAAQEAFEASVGDRLLFPRYDGRRGPDAASAALMKHLRAETSDRRHTVHSLRHNMKDRLREAGIDGLRQNMLLGHAVPGLGDKVYGSDQGKLKELTPAMRKAMGVERA